MRLKETTRRDIQSLTTGDGARLRVPANCAARSAGQAVGRGPALRYIGIVAVEYKDTLKTAEITAV